MRVVELLAEEVSPAEQRRRQELHARWRQLVNMSAGELEKWLAAQLRQARVDPRKHPGMRPAAAARLGISAGVQSARQIIKMKRTPVKNWSASDWRWAGKQVSFISRMRGAPGRLYDDNGEPTRKLLALKVWGHDPERR